VLGEGGDGGLLDDVVDLLLVELEEGGQRLLAAGDELVDLRGDRRLLGGGRGLGGTHLRSPSMSGSRAL